MKEDLDWGVVLTMLFLLKEWKQKPLNKEGYLVIRDFDKFTNDFDKFTNDFNKWKLEKYPHIDIDKKFKGDLFKLLKEEE